MTDNKIPRAPKGLGHRGKALWRELHTEFDMSADPHRRVLVEDACREADLVDRLRAVVDAAENLRVKGSQGQPVKMPELEEIRLHRKTLSDLLKALALPDTEELAEVKAKHLSDVRRTVAKQARLKVV
ncbi:hypothetical protein [Prescottella equi]|uniref:hypothetical protein n=1 Tax=Rhodococcus hoagii TaxID=43767 RepID=UPI001C76136C|nr:hypothetical protein [Prescottella equi]BCN45254.1 hypothetical protein RE9414_35340 [Prescottella equi]